MVGKTTKVLRCGETRLDGISTIYVRINIPNIIHTYIIEPTRQTIFTHSFTKKKELSSPEVFIFHDSISDL